MVKRRGINGETDWWRTIGAHGCLTLHARLFNCGPLIAACPSFARNFHRDGGKQRGLGRGVATNGEQCRAQRGWIIFHGFGTIAPRWRCVRFFQTGIRVPPPCDARVMVGASREMEFSNQLLTFFFCFVSFRSIFKACLVQDIALWMKYCWLLFFIFRSVGVILSFDKYDVDNFYFFGCASYDENWSIFSFILSKVQCVRGMFECWRYCVDFVDLDNSRVIFQSLCYY